MTRNDPQPIGKILGEAGEALGVSSPGHVGKVWAEWAGIVGPGIAAHAEPTSLRSGVLRVRADSPAWATELGYLAEEIKTRVNRAVGTELVREVRVWIGARKERTPRRQEAAAAPAEPPSHPPAEDPQEAFERARSAWSKRVRRAGRGGRRGPLENEEKPR